MELPTSLRSLLIDALLVDRLELMWEEGDPRSWAADLLSGVQHFAPVAASFAGSLAAFWHVVAC
eukprot:2283786-Amphidinium_carterae.1